MVANHTAMVYICRRRHFGYDRRSIFFTPSGVRVDVQAKFKNEWITALPLPEDKWQLAILCANGFANGCFTMDGTLNFHESRLRAEENPLLASGGFTNGLEQIFGPASLIVM